MKTLLLLAALASSSAAAPLKCAGGGTPRLTGDLFGPVDCSSATLPVAALPVPPARPEKIDLKPLAGAYEGTVIEGFGRYDLRLELKTSWFGRAEATLKLLELQFHAATNHELKLVPAGGPGRYATVLTTDVLPGAELAGDATAGEVAVSTPTAGAPAAAAGERQMDFRFSNGTVYRVRFAPQGASALRARVWWAVPGAPARSFETVLTRAAAAKP